MLKSMFKSTHKLTPATATMVLVALPMPFAFAQSSNRDQPTPILSNDINGTLEPQSDFFYSFNADPGDVSIRFDLMPSSGSIAVATLQLYDESGNELLNTPLIPTANSRAGDRQSVSITIPARQRVLMRITEGTGYGGTYRVHLEGAIAFGTTNGGNSTVLNTPSSGILRIELGDGSAQEFDLSRVRRVLGQTLKRLSLL